MLRRACVVLLVLLAAASPFNDALSDVTQKVDKGSSPGGGDGEVFFNAGRAKKYKDLTGKLENSVLKSKIEILGAVFKKHIDYLRSVANKQVELVFLVDSSASVGVDNFLSELAFVQKLLADFSVSHHTTRVAVITFASQHQVTRHVDHIAEPSVDKHKCGLLHRELPRIRYTGGGTYTRGALLEAETVLKYARPSSHKAVFLITDGFSNGGDPIPIANQLKQNGVTVFTFGIRNGNTRELFQMASSPGQEYSYILDSFSEFQALARRALHEDLKSGEYLQLDNVTSCDHLCHERRTCCDESAVCACGIDTGHFVCLCPPGYYGPGLTNTCQACPNGTYSDESVPGDVSICKPCPDTNHVTMYPATSPDHCTCAAGLQPQGNRCDVITCPKLSPPAKGYFVKKTCLNVLNAACGTRCSVGYQLMGSSIRLCQENGTWSGQEAKCIVKTCPPLPAPARGNISCTRVDNALDTECTAACQHGYYLVGSKRRTCLPLGRWDGLTTTCKSLTCPPLPQLSHGLIEPAECTASKRPYGSQCNITCAAGFTLRGPDWRTCGGQAGVWTNKKTASQCVDVTPPTIACPESIVTSTDLDQSYATVTWPVPVAADNSGIEPTLWTKPATTLPMKMRIGVTTITYVASDGSRNKARCSFKVTVTDNQSPTVDSCESPPTFLTNQGGEVPLVWDPPVFSDNSGQAVQVVRTPDTDRFDYGTTEVTYVASDAFANNSTCVIYITVQENECIQPADPLHGHMDCTHLSETLHCTLTCSEGYAFAITPRDYFCMAEGDVILAPDTSVDPVPDCSVSILPTKVTERGRLTLEVESDDDVTDDDALCRDAEMLAQISNEVRWHIAAKLGAPCLNDITCELSNVTSACDRSRSSDEEEFNTIARRKREMGSEFSQTEDREAHNTIPRRKREMGSEFSQTEDREAHNTIPRRKRETGNILKNAIDKSFEEGNSVGRTGDVYNRVNRRQIREEDNATLSELLERIRTMRNGIANKTAREEALVKMANVRVDASGGGRREEREKPKEKGMPRRRKRNVEENNVQYLTDTLYVVEAKERPKVAKTKIEVHFQMIGHVRDNGGTAKSLTGELRKVKESLDELTNQGSAVLPSKRKKLKMKKIGFRPEPLLGCPLGSLLRGQLCVKCPIGTHHNNVLKSCESCAIGEYQPLEGQASCVACPPGSSTRRIHARHSGECKPLCAPGSYARQRKLAKATPGVTPCATCERGGYQPRPGQLACKPCPAGTTTNRRGATSVTQCIAPCLPGFFSPTGHAPCHACDPRLAACNRTNSDACALGPCQNGGTCGGSGEGYFTCDCPPGFVGSYCEVSLNACDSDPCLHGSLCIVKPNHAFSCVCKPGYTGAQCEVDIDDCASSPCLNNGACVDQVNGYQCLFCAEGYTGANCEEVVDQCAAAPCANNATCSGGVNNYTCACAAGYTGRHCQHEPSDPCEGEPCKNGGVCVTQGSSYKCVCPAGHSGLHCETTPCTAAPCLNGATCTPHRHAAPPPPGYTCACAAGYTGALCQVAVPPEFMLQFPVAGTTDYVAVRGPSVALEQVSVCLWLKSADKFNYGTVFSYATRTVDNCFTLTDYNGFVLYVNGDRVITDVIANDGAWHFVCVTWQADAGGAWTLYIDGRAADGGVGLSNGTSIPANGSLILGQEQDRLGGGFSQSESFMGLLSKVAMWDRVLGEQEIVDMATLCDDGKAGNVFAWSDFLVGIRGQLKIETSTFCSGCEPPPTPHRASVNVSATAEVGGVAIYTCTPGYNLRWPDGDVATVYTRKCLKQGDWEGDTPICTRISCGFPGYFPHGVILGRSYRYGDRLNYTCNEEYRLIGEAVRECSAAGRWSGAVPTCRGNDVMGKSCPAPNPPEHGRIARYFDSDDTQQHRQDATTSSQVGHQVEFECDAGHTLDDAYNVLTCLETGQWDDAVPECRPIRCPVPGELGNGTITSRNNSGGVHSYGDIVDVGCDQGYQLVGPSSRLCLAHGVWSSDEPFCKPTTCDVDKLPFYSRYFSAVGDFRVRIFEEDIGNGALVISGTRYGNTAAFQCKPGYRFVDDAARDRLAWVCQSGGEWELAPTNGSGVHVASTNGSDGGVVSDVVLTNGSGGGGASDVLLTNGSVGSVVKDATVTNGGSGDVASTNGSGGVDVDAEVFARIDTICQPIGNNCSEPVPPANGYLLEREVSSTSVGSTVSYKCRLGYLLRGPEQAMCQHDGQWSNAGMTSCEPVECKRLPAPLHTAPITETDVPLVYGNMVKHVCEEGYTAYGDMATRCQANGRWSRIRGKCSRVSCGKPSLSNGATVQGMSYLYQDKVVYQCPPGAKTSGAPVLTCQKDGTWDATASCLAA